MSADYALKLGDAATWLAKLKPESIDSLVCDPPAGIEFMGKSWDADHGGRAAWVAAFAALFRECWRTMKPGAHGLVWALPRTSHWTATALEDAGFEIRDVVMHLFGTGFPKSLNVSKAIDAAAGAVRLPNGTVTTRHGGGAHSDKIRQLNPAAKVTPNTTPATAEALRFDGWGTALKPAAEHWILVRKPLIGTVAENVLAHGTGAINVDGCRVESGADYHELHVPQGVGEVSTSYNPRAAPRTFEPGPGRWPANVTLDEEAAAELDAQSGITVSRASTKTIDEPNLKNKVYGRGMGGLVTPQNQHNDSGGASRFFYVAKPGRRERDAGCEDLPPRSGGEATGREDGSDGLGSPRAGAGRTGGARNHHPTVKSVALMRWLCRLITPPGGFVLDPFLGSGSTGVAAILEGFRFVGIERESEYMEIAKRRIAWAAAQPASDDEETAA